MFRLKRHRSCHQEQTTLCVYTLQSIPKSLRSTKNHLDMKNTKIFKYRDLSIFHVEVISNSWTNKPFDFYERLRTAAINVNWHCFLIRLLKIWTATWMIKSKINDEIILNILKCLLFKLTHQSPCLMELIPPCNTDFEFWSHCCI